MKVWALLLLNFSFCASPAYAQLSQEPQFNNSAQKESWLEWRLLQTLKDTLLPAYIAPQAEEDVQHWLGEVKKYKSEFSQANDHVLKMDQATRAHDINTTNAEAKEAADILDRIPWKPYTGTDEFNDTHDSSGNNLNGSVSQDSNSNPNSNWNPSFTFPPITGGYPPSMSSFPPSLPGNYPPSMPGNFPPLAPQRPFTGGGTGMIPTNLPPAAREPGISTPSKPTNAPQETPHIVNGNAGKHFSKPEEALKDWATSVWTLSKAWNVEVAGKLYKNWDDTWSSSPSHPGTRNSSQPEKAMPYVIQHGSPLFNYDIHSHGSYAGLNATQQKSVDQLSDDDRFRSDLTGNPQFVLTPGGVVKEFVPDPIGRFGFGLTGPDGKTKIIGDLNSDAAWETPEGL